MNHVLIEDFLGLAARQGFSKDAALQQLQVVEKLGRGLIAAIQGKVFSVIGIAGSQGSGKSTLAEQLVWWFRQQDVVAIATSIDDFYHPLAVREKLAADVHPLLRTRGVPGTHDVQLLQHVIDCLERGLPASLPMFDKAQDDRMIETQEVPGGVEVLLLEGWCVGAPALDPADITMSLNELERNEDADGRWRKYLAERLAEPGYQRIFSRLDQLVFLQVPSMDQVFRWRDQQEEALRSAPDTSRGQGVMSSAEIRRFIMFYERITLHMFATMPGKADFLILVDDQHRWSDPRVIVAG